jgi:hypothetical protein
VTDLVRAGAPGDGTLDGLRARVSTREAELRARTGELTGVEAALTAFKIRYRQDVGLLHEELDELEQAISAAELGEIHRRLEQEGQPAAAPPSSRLDSAPRYTSDAVRALFRDVAKAIHPDLSRGDHTRDRRHALMIEANRAYAKPGCGRSSARGSGAPRPSSAATRGPLGSGWPGARRRSRKSWTPAPPRSPS